MTSRTPSRSLSHSKMHELKAASAVIVGAAVLAGGLLAGCRRAEDAPPTGAAGARGSKVAPTEAAGPESFSARLVAAGISVIPGKPFTLGVELQAPAGWHTYWEHPGETGLAPTFTWKLPDGIREPKLHLPVPHWFDDDGIFSFGYEGTVRFLAEFETDAALAEGTVELGGEILWMICKDMCLPIQSSLSATLVAAKDGDVPAEDADTALWRSRLPLDTPRWEISAKAGEDGLTVRMAPAGAGAPEAKAWSNLRFFPLRNGGIGLAARPVWTRDGDAWQALLAPGMQPYAPGDAFEAVIASGEQDDWKGWRISATVE